MLLAFFTRDYCTQANNKKILTRRVNRKYQVSCRTKSLQILGIFNAIFCDPSVDGLIL